MTEPIKTPRNLSGKLHDPVFLCMVGAVILAIGTSLALRAVVAGAGPAAAHGAEMGGSEQTFPPLHVPKSHNQSQK